MPVREQPKNGLSQIDESLNSAMHCLIVVKFGRLVQCSPQGHFNGSVHFWSNPWSPKWKWL